MEPIETPGHTLHMDHGHAAGCLRQAPPDLLQVDFSASLQSEPPCEREAQLPNSPARKSGGGLADLTLPPDVAIYAAGAYSGRKTAFQIDQSSHQAMQIEVAVFSADQPVVLMPGAYEPTRWQPRSVLHL